MKYSGVMVLLPAYFVFFLLNLIELSSGCFYPDPAFSTCLRKYNFHGKSLGLKGYDFGFGSIEDVEDMCKDKWHIIVLNCFQNILKRNCSSSDNQFQNVMWRHMLDSERYERAADYLCRPTNLELFRSHKSCLYRFEHKAYTCSKLRKEWSAKTLETLKNNHTFDSGRIPYHISIKKLIDDNECTGLRYKIRCLSNLLIQGCSPNIVELIKNYFREALPTNCVLTTTPVPTTTAPFQYNYHTNNNAKLNSQRQISKDNPQKASSMSNGNPKKSSYCIKESSKFMLIISFILMVFI